MKLCDMPEDKKEIILYILDDIASNEGYRGEEKGKLIESALKEEVSSFIKYLDSTDQEYDTNFLYQ